MNLLDRRLVVVVGKGGVGRTTAALAIAHAAARVGRRVAVVELYGQGVIPRWYGLGDAAYRPRRVAPGVDTLSLTAMDSIADFGRRKLRIPMLPRLLRSNRAIRAFIDAVPGLHDLFQLGKVNNLLEDPAPGETRYDMLVLDAPATGHGVTLLQAAQSMREMTRVGRFSDEARQVEELFGDIERTCLVLVTLPDVLPVNESLQLVEELGAKVEQLAAVIVNQVRPDRFPVDPTWAEARTTLDDPALVRIGDDATTILARQRTALERLRAAVPELAGRQVPITCLSRVEPHELRPEDVAQFGVSLAAALT